MGADRAVIVVFIGPPGSGKSTQAELLSRKCGIPHFEMGEILRELAAQDNAVGREIRTYMDRGLLVPERTVKQVIADRLRRPDFQRGFIIDGFPRSVEQARTFDQMLRDAGKEITAVVLFEVPVKVAIGRLSGRRICAGCGAAYQGKAAPGIGEGLCSRCGGKLLQRRDDLPEVIRARLNVFARDTAPLIDFYARRHLLTRIDASRSVDEVFAALAAAVPCDPRHRQH